ncbi:unnamed protein product, partial [Polarella glacialis]
DRSLSGAEAAQVATGPPVQTPSPSKRSALPSDGGKPLGGSRGPTLQQPGGDAWQGSPLTDINVSPTMDSTATMLDIK